MLNILPHVQVVRVTVSDNGILRVSVPDSYSNSLCGLCGNFNGDPSDDTDASISVPEEAGAQIAGSYLIPDPNTP